MPSLDSSSLQNVSWCQIRGRMFGWMNWGLTQVLRLSCSDVCLSIQRNSGQQADVYRNPLNSFLGGCTWLKGRPIPSQHSWKGWKCMEKFLRKTTIKIVLFECSNSSRKSALNFFYSVCICFIEDEMHAQWLEISKSVIFKNAHPSYFGDTSHCSGFIGPQLERY